MRLRTLSVLTRTLLLTTVAVGTLTPASVAVAGAVSPSSAKPAHKGSTNPITRAEAFFTCSWDQQRFDRIQRIEHAFHQEMASIQASENQASKANEPTVVAHWKFDMTQRQHYETYLLRYWHSSYDKKKKYEIYILTLHKKSDAVAKGEARLKACKLSKLTFPPSKAAPAKPPASTPSTTKPAAKTPPKSSTTTTPPKSSTTTTAPKSSTTTAPPASSSTSTTTPPASSTTTTGPSANATTPAGPSANATTPAGSSTTVLPASTTTSGT
jgi:hypothetical protein